MGRKQQMHNPLEFDSSQRLEINFFTFVSEKGKWSPETRKLVTMRYDKRFIYNCLDLAFCERHSRFQKYARQFPTIWNKFEDVLNGQEKNGISCQ